MDGIAAGFSGNGDELWNIQVRGSSGAFKDAGLIRLAGMQRARIVPGRDRYRGYVELSRRPNDPDGDLSSIRYKHFHLESRSPQFNSSPPLLEYVTHCPVPEVLTTCLSC
jgi:hypothetical protein